MGHCQKILYYHIGKYINPYPAAKVYTSVISTAAKVNLTKCSTEDAHKPPLSPYSIFILMFMIINIVGLAKIRWPFHFKWCYINVILYSNNQVWWYILHCRDQKKSFPVIYNIIMLHVFIYVNLQKKRYKKWPFFTVMLLHFIFCKFGCVIIHFISIKYSKIDIPPFSEIIELHSILYRFEIFEFLLKLCLKMCTPPFVM